MVDTVKCVISSSMSGLLGDPETLTIDVICFNDAEKRLVASEPIMRGNISFYTLTEATRRKSTADLQLFLDVPGNTCSDGISEMSVRVSVVSHALQVVQQDESAKLALMKRLCRGKSGASIPASEALARMEHPTINPKWTSSLKVFWNSRDRLSSQPQAVFKLKHYCKLWLIERNLKKDETIIVDPNSCVTVTTISSIADGSFALKSDNGVSLLERYSRVCLIVLDDGIRRAVRFVDIVENLVGPVKKANRTTDFTWIPIKLETDLAPAVCQVCNSFAPTKPELVRVTYRWHR